MPAGKPDVVAGLGGVKPLPYSISVSALRRLAKASARPLTPADTQELRHALRSAFRQYALAKATPAPTATERARYLTQIRKSAERLLKSKPTTIKDGVFGGERGWANRLLDVLGETDHNTKVLIGRYMNARGYRWVHFMRGLMAVAVGTGPLDPIRGALEALAGAAIDAEPAAPDPALTHLVRAVAPIWRRVTGRTVGRVSIDATGEAKSVPFAVWLNEMLAAADLDPVPAGRVLAASEN